MWLVAGCAGTSQENTGAAGEQKGASTNEGKTSSHSFPKTIKHMKGETVIPNKPMELKRAANYRWRV